MPTALATNLICLLLVLCFFCGIWAYFRLTVMCPNCHGRGCEVCDYTGRVGRPRC